MIIKVAIADTNQNYLERLMAGLEKYEDLNLSVYTDGDSLKQAFQERKYDVLLFSPDIYANESEFYQAKADLKVMLEDKDELIQGSYADAKRIDKYQRISNIYKSILELYSEVCGKGFAGAAGYTSVIAYFSPIGGAGKTTVALASAAKFAMTGKRTFYISFEDIASEDCFLPQGEDKGLSELMLHIERNTNISMKLQGMLKQKAENFYYLNHFSSPNDIYDMRLDELQDLIVAIRNADLFDVMIIDMGTEINEKNKLIFEKADRIVLVEREDSISQRKMGSFLAQQHIINEFGGKMVRFINFDKGIPVSIQTEVPITGKLGAVANADSGKVIEILANSSKTQFLTSVI